MSRTPNDQMSCSIDSSSIQSHTAFSNDELGSRIPLRIPEQNRMLQNLFLPSLGSLPHILLTQAYSPPTHLAAIPKAFLSPAAPDSDTGYAQPLPQLAPSPPRASLALAVMSERVMTLRGRTGLVLGERRGTQDSMLV
jgi:hypothetical protein